ncbi:hypothetical protein N7449_007505 [Penicillium cf. viridicatum]|uniref:Uncharacterized protein n=1 Tax=Penicillium cf. viridicatum TaxID=2972119 RepID=A0A9W9JMJ7_9EURO|nr:hypothetical protein N7449_007505 [Penicillium cf. viridicatum]
MKVLPTFLSLALFSVAYAAPSGNGTYTSNQSAYSAGVAQAGLERLTSAQCMVVAKRVWARTTLEMAAQFGSKTSEGFQFIFDVGYIYKIGTAVADASSVYISSRRSLPSNDDPSIEDVLKLSAYSYDSVEIITLPTDEIKTRDNEPSLLSRHILKNNNKALFYYRTIVEGNGFGENYEAVDACGVPSHYV